MRCAVAGQAKLSHPAGYQHPRIGGAVRRMTRAASFRLHRGMLESEWSLLVRMTFHAGRICARGQPRLLEFKTAMWIVAVAALHSPFQYLVMEG